MGRWNGEGQGGKRKCGGRTVIEMQNKIKINEYIKKEIK